MALPIDTRQPSLAMMEVIPLQGVYPSRDSDNSGITLGALRTFAGTFAPDGSAAASGQLIQIAQNTQLFSLLGTTFGGNGQSTFALPDLDVRTAVGDGQGTGLSLVNLGQQVGAALVNLAQGNLLPTLGGTSIPFNEGQPSLGTKYLIRTEGIFPSGLDFGTIGTVIKFAGNFAPGGYMECDGQLLDIAEHDALFQLIGTTYGGDGVTTFALPDLRGRAIVGTASANDIGQVLGQESVTLTNAQLPTNMGGGGQPVDNREPSLVMNYIIALQGIFPGRPGQGSGFQDQEPLLGEVTVFAGNFAPTGWALCQGQLLSISQNTALFSLLGTTYGGNGITNFALPDLRGRNIVGAGDGIAPGTVLGNDTVTITADHIPPLTYSGTAGADTLYGGNSNDSISGLASSDTINGNGGADTLNGGANDDTLNGGSGNDVLEGSTGSDIMRGHAGDDTFRVDDAFDQVLEAAAQGVDNIVASVSYVLAAGFAVEIIRTTNAAGTAAINLTGNNLVNNVIGNVGANILNGGGGTDILQGLAGNDAYYVDNSADVIVETTGTDNVNTSVSYTLGAGVSVETLRTTNPAGTTAINLTGNNLANIVIGNAGANILSGGSGADTLRGLGGSDTYIVDSASDTIAEIASGGLDTLRTSVSYVLAPNVSIEVVRTINDAGTAAINLTGNNLSNLIVGNNGANVIDGKAGADNLQGLGGNDIYVVGNTGDVVTEAASAGRDLVQSAVTFTLGANIENAILTGAAAINDIGNALANSLIGNSGNNTLNGKGGNDQLSGASGHDFLFGDLGLDTLIGGGGNDRFDFNSAAETGVGAARDVITDFLPGADRIDLSTIDANGAAAGHTFAFLAANGAAFGGLAGQLRWFQQNLAGTANDKTIVEGDINGNKVADFQIELTGLKTLTAADFVL